MVRSIALILLGALFHQTTPCVTLVELPEARTPVRPLTDSSSAWEKAKRYQLSGEDHRREGNLESALADFESAAKIMERLVALHPENVAWQRDLSLSKDKIGDVLLGQGNLSGALEDFRAALTLRKSIVAADPSSSEWQRNIFVSHNKIGDAYMAQGDLKPALESYLAAYGVVQDLVRGDQSNEQWQRDLASCQHRIGGVFLAAGNTSGAIDMYGAAVKVEERLADIDRENTTLLRDLALSHGHLAQTLRETREVAKAADEFEKGRAIIAALLVKEPNNEQFRKDLEWFDSQLATTR